MILEWQYDGDAFTAQGRHHRYEISFDPLGKACLIQSSSEGGASPVLRTSSGFVAATRMKGQAQVWEGEVAPRGTLYKRREPKRWTERMFGWGPFGSAEHSQHAPRTGLGGEAR